MRGSTVPCPILCMCLLSSYIVNVWIGVVIYHQELRSCLFYEIGENKENHSRGELLMLGS